MVSGALFSPTGKALTDFVFDELKSNYGICEGRIGDYWRFVTFKGQILPEQFDMIHAFHEMRDGKYIYTIELNKENGMGYITIKEK